MLAAMDMPWLADPERRDRALGVLGSAALHVGLLLACLLTGAPGIGSGNQEGSPGAKGMALAFVETSDFRQRVVPVSSSVSLSAANQSANTHEFGEAATDEASVPATPSSQAIEAITENISAWQASASAQTSPPLTLDSPVPATRATDQAGDAITATAAGSGEAGNDDGLRTAYLAALRAAIRKQWVMTGSPVEGHCILAIRQQPGQRPMTVSWVRHPDCRWKRRP